MASRGHRPSHPQQPPTFSLAIHSTGDDGDDDRTDGNHDHYDPSTHHHLSGSNSHSSAFLGTTPPVRSFLNPGRQSPAQSFLSPDSHRLAPDMSTNSFGGFDGHSHEPSSAMDIPGEGAPNPFNFQTQVISTSPVKPAVGQRRGHKYKHSSVSAQHQIFQEPRHRAPLALPRDLPVPTTKEAWKSMSVDQRRRLYWCFCHLVVAVFVFLHAHGSLAMTALSHLVFFDAGSALICVGVDVLGNFEVWKRSSIRHPFGLERAEVLAGFAMSVFLIFGGFDLVSHNVKHVLEGQGGHEPHHPDPHDAHDHPDSALGVGRLNIASIAVMAATLVSAFGLKNHARISKFMRVSYLSSLPSVLSNPFHFLTLSTAGLMLILPLLSIRINIYIDSSLCAIVAVAMFALGFQVAAAQGLMLLMSYGGKAGTDKTGDVTVADVLREIEAETAVERIEEAQFWQVHYGLCMANLKLCVTKGADDATLSRLRTRVATLIQNRLGEGYGKGGSLRWEVTLQMGS
ncbi:cation efflux family-domain-containing protein [Microdochium bolleyi]|uniref:Zinc transporter n=1 Tax=Microdochium bolleyi TaxID=196109 RepID=A0A136J7I8_9PEZI|nr:cation efflux family-domain-containing protein [Microdochium bolleyi]